MQIRLISQVSFWLLTSNVFNLYSFKPIGADKEKYLLYISNKKYKGLYKEGTTLSLYLGIDSDRLFSENRQIFSYDFMFDEIIYNTYGNYICEKKSMCDYKDESKF